MSSAIHNVEDRVQIISARVQGVSHGESLAWENLEWLDEFETEFGSIILVKGDDDLAASLIADMTASRKDSSLGRDIHLIEIPEV